MEARLVVPQISLNLTRQIAFLHDFSFNDKSVGFYTHRHESFVVIVCSTTTFDSEPVSFLVIVAQPPHLTASRLFRLNLSLPVTCYLRA